PAAKTLRARRSRPVRIRSEMMNTAISAMTFSALSWLPLSGPINYPTWRPRSAGIWQNFRRNLAGCKLADSSNPYRRNGLTTEFWAEGLEGDARGHRRGRRPRGGMRHGIGDVLRRGPR